MTGPRSCPRQRAISSEFPREWTRRPARDDPRHEPHRRPRRSRKATPARLLAPGSRAAARARSPDAPARQGPDAAAQDALAALLGTQVRTPAAAAQPTGTEGTSLGIQYSASAQWSWSPCTRATPSRPPTRPRGSRSRRRCRATRTASWITIPTGGGSRGGRRRRCGRHRSGRAGGSRRRGASEWSWLGAGAPVSRGSRGSRACGTTGGRGPRSGGRGVLVCGGRPCGCGQAAVTP